MKFDTSKLIAKRKFYKKRDKIFKDLTSVEKESLQCEIEYRLDTLPLGIELRNEKRTFDDELEMLSREKGRIALVETILMGLMNVI